MTSVTTSAPTPAKGDSSTLEGRFEFGRNWRHFLATLNESRIAQAIGSLQRLLRVSDLQGLSFLDAGSGSGLFSLAAQRLGARVRSFDYDPESVACTVELKSRFAAEDSNFVVTKGSVLDREFLATLGTYDLVYSWGVLHHTGAMWQGLENLLTVVAPNGQIALAIYNDQQYISRAWSAIKRLYQRLPRPLRPLLVFAVGAAGFLKRLASTLAACLLRLLTLRNPVKPLTNWIGERQSRGMHAWYDLVDWVGGWPFEVATPEAVFRFLRDRGFVLQEMTTSGGHGCNEFVFRRIAK
jgi:2-polyprenyl-6-hydroxyphenyl methylase/3-demethylubiquinone-9 3-methyltransferase